MTAETLSRKVIHGTASASRDLAHPPERVFAAFSELPLRDRWFRMPGSTGHELDFRVGGGETASGVTEISGETERIEWRSHILDIVEDRRIVFAYEIVVNGLRRNTSLVTVETEPEGEGTMLRYTEQYAVTHYNGDGSQDERHIGGSHLFLLNRLEAALAN